MSKFSIGQMNQLGNAMEADGWSDELVTKLGQSGRLADIRALLEGRAEVVMEKVKKTVEVVKSILKPVKTVIIQHTEAKRTDECFTDTKKYYRDSSVLKLLPETQEARGEETCQVSQTTEESRFVGMIQSLLDDTAKTATKVLSQLLIKSGRVLTLIQVEQLVERQEAGEDMGLLTNGWANFFLVLDKEGSVSVVNVDRLDGQWHVFVYVLGDADVWCAEYRFFCRN